MRESAQKERRRLIEEAAYALIDEKGYDNISMLAIAKRAKASNETLYRWYGDKKGLFQAMVIRNADDVYASLVKDLEAHRDPMQILEDISLKLVRLLTSDRAIALNRAAAADASGELGKALSEVGRDRVLPLISKVLGQIKDQGTFGALSLDDVTRLYMNLLIGDLQIRRAIGVIPALSDDELKLRTRQALDYLLKFA
ncbi:MAG: TetR/AcrR family transcriptional regulator [Rhizobiaceae bacterium]|nr:TetR/AcrR family transcriptional regulator [Rhizobiaceae bacterium]